MAAFEILIISETLWVNGCATSARMYDDKKSEGNFAIIATDRYFQVDKNLPKNSCNKLVCFPHGQWLQLFEASFDANLVVSWLVVLKMKKVYDG